ncbi:MAG: hypothetical protein VXY87_03305, partial [Pseudomonadota bacterium]|nr:hypothetical protein [Pseudomonadota bacterium]
TINLPLNTLRDFVGRQVKIFNKNLKILDSARKQIIDYTVGRSLSASNYNNVVGQLRHLKTRFRKLNPTDLMVLLQGLLPEHVSDNIKFVLRHDFDHGDNLNSLTDMKELIIGGEKTLHQKKQSMPPDMMGFLTTDDINNVKNQNTESLVNLVNGAIDPFDRLQSIQKIVDSNKELFSKVSIFGSEPYKFLWANDTKEVAIVISTIEADKDMSFIDFEGVGFKPKYKGDKEKE